MLKFGDISNVSVTASISTVTSRVFYVRYEGDSFTTTITLFRRTRTLAFAIVELLGYCCFEKLARAGLRRTHRQIWLCIIGLLALIALRSQTRVCWLSCGAADAEPNMLH